MIELVLVIALVARWLDHRCTAYREQVEAEERERREALRLGLRRLHQLENADKRRLAILRESAQRRLTIRGVTDDEHRGSRA